MKSSNPQQRRYENLKSLITALSQELVCRGEARVRRPVLPPRGGESKGRQVNILNKQNIYIYIFCAKKNFKLLRQKNSIIINSFKVLNFYQERPLYFRTPGVKTPSYVTACTYNIVFTTHAPMTKLGSDK